MIKTIAAVGLPVDEVLEIKKKPYSAGDTHGQYETYQYCYGHSWG